jgi:penicillin-binding protein 1A
MTNVHGIEVAGGTFPARIWHDYMQTAKGAYCGGFPKPQTPFQSAPFFGKYASTGGNGQDNNFNGGNGGGSAHGFETNGTGGGGTGSAGGGGKYNKRYYASPPQPPPNVGGH